jgi:hypothetical protein
MGSGSGAITALRVFRLIRVFQLLKNWRTLQELLKVILNTFKDLAVIILLIGILIYIYMLIGLELFSFKLQSDTKVDSNFNDILNSFLSVFIVFSNDGWSKIYFTHYQAAEPISTTLFFISLLIIGQFLLLNLLISIIIENFEYFSVKNDLINKIDNMKREEEEQKMTLMERA